MYFHNKLLFLEFYKTDKIIEFKEEIKYIPGNRYKFISKSQKKILEKIQCD